MIIYIIETNTPLVALKPQVVFCIKRYQKPNPDPEKMRRIFWEQSANKINKSIECSRDKLLK